MIEYVSALMKVRKLSSGSSFADKTVSWFTSSQSSSALLTPPLRMFAIIAPVLRSMTLIELGVVTALTALLHLRPVGLGLQPLRTGASVAQISRWSTMITPFGPDAFAGLATMPTNGGFAVR